MIQTRRPTRLYQGYIFDLDGTIYLGEALLPGARRAIKALRRTGCRVAFVSNNPTKTRQAYAAKLTRLGLPTPVQDVINSSYVMVNYLLERAPGAHLFPISEQPLIDELRAAGFAISGTRLCPESPARAGRPQRSTSVG